MTKLNFDGVPRRLIAGLALLSAFGAAPAHAAGETRLAAISPGQITAETGAARRLDLGDLSMHAPASAETMRVGYEIYVGGFHLATINLAAMVDHGHYVAGTLVSTKGLAQAFASSDLQAISTGTVDGHLVVPHTYNSDTKTEKKRQLVGLLFKNHQPVEINSDPVYNLKKRPVSEAQRADTVDPVSAAIFISLGSSADAQDKCGTKVPIFDGKRRYDLDIMYGGQDKISLGRDSFNGGKPLATYKCTARYVRIAGFKPPKPGDKPFPPIDVWLAPFPGTDFLVPVRMEAMTSLGAIVVRAVDVKVTPPASRG